MHKVLQVHADIEAQISRLTKESSKTLAECNDLYSNIAYPLAVTVCHSDDLPRATIAEHLVALKTKVMSAEDELKKLGMEWDACAEAEREA